MKRKFQTALTSVFALLTFAFGATAVQAATITIDPLDSSVMPGATFDVTIVGLDFTEFAGGTIGGGFSLAWDSSVLMLDSVNLSFAGDQLFGQAGTVDNVAGTLLNADVTSFNGVTAFDFDIAVLTFTAVGLGSTALDLSIGLFDNGSERIWADSSGFNDTMPLFVDGSVNVIPIPAAVWLFGSGLIGLIGVARRRM